VVSFTPRPLYPSGKNPWYPLDRRLGRPQNRSRHGGEEKNSQPIVKTWIHKKLLTSCSTGDNWNLSFLQEFNSRSKIMQTRKERSFKIEHLN
jgi:hypothetical protein